MAKEGCQNTVAGKTVLLLTPNGKSGGAGWGQEKMDSV